MTPLALSPANDIRLSPKRLARRGAQSGNAGQGGNWIRKKRRHAIYARDSAPHGPDGDLAPACVWCGRTGLVGGVDCVHSGATLDHFLAREHGGTNETSNLLTCCFGRNSKRRSMSALEFAGLLANGDTALRFVVLERVLAALDRAT